MDQRARLDKATADFINGYKNLLNEKMIKPFEKFKRILDKGGSLTPNQHNYLDGMYETVMGKLTGEKVDVHVDLKFKHKTNLHY